MIGKQAREHARLDLLEARQRRGARAVLERDGVAHRRAVDLLDAGDDEADVAGRQLSLDDGLRREAAELVDRVAAAGRHDADLLAGLERCR